MSQLTKNIEEMNIKKTIQSKCPMKYECTIIIYKENKHIKLSYNVKKDYEKVFFQ